jgi:hypothetical protein
LAQAEEDAQAAAAEAVRERAAMLHGQVRCVWSFLQHSSGNYWRFPFKRPKSGADISKFIVGTDQK